MLVERPEDDRYEVALRVFEVLAEISQIVKPRDELLACGIAWREDALHHVIV